MSSLQLLLQPLSNRQALTLAFEISLTVLIAFVINVVLRSLIRVPRKIGSARSETYVLIIKNIISAIIFVVTTHYIFILLNINIAPLLASAGLLGLVIGFGAKSIIEDLISGFFLYGQAAVTLGDYVKVGDVEGFVETIGIRTMAIRGETGALQLIPNSMVKQITNFSRGKAHVYVDIPVKSDQRVDSIIEVLEDALDVLQKNKKFGSFVYDDSHVLGVESIKEGGIMVMRIDISTHTTKRWDVAREYRYAAKSVGEKHKIVFA